eukprot:864123-Amphidinium_carterae.2
MHVCSGLPQAKVIGMISKSYVSITMLKPHSKQGWQLQREKKCIFHVDLDTLLSTPFYTAHVGFSPPPWPLKSIP